MPITQKANGLTNNLMSVKRQVARILRARTLLNGGRTVRVSRPGDLLDGVRAALGDWPRFSKEAGLSDSASQRVAADFRLL